MKQMMIAGLALAAVLVAGIGCQDQNNVGGSSTTQPAAVAKTTPTPAATPASDGAWKTAFTADFKGDKLDPRWVALEGEAKLDKGCLLISAADASAQLLLKDPSFDTPSVRMEFVASFEKADTLSDLSVFFNVSKAGDFADGYLFQCGGKANTQNDLLRTGETVESTINKKGLPLESGKKYNVVVENDKGNLKMTVNGTTVVEYKDSKPVSGAKNGHVGFYIWGCKLRVEKLSVSTK